MYYRSEFCVGFSNHCDAEDASMLCGGLHHFALVTKKMVKVMGINHSVHGYLWEKEQYSSGATIDHRRLGIEGEMAVVVRRR